MDQNERDKAIRQSVKDRLLRRAVEDQDFRRLLIDNPKSALARELGIDVPDDIHVTVLPETASHLYIVIPPEASELENGVKHLANFSPAYGGGGCKMSCDSTDATGVERLMSVGSAYGK